MPNELKKIEKSLCRWSKLTAIIFLVLNLSRAVAATILLMGIYLQLFGGEPELINHYPIYSFVLVCLIFISWLIRFAPNTCRFNGNGRWWYLLVFLGIFCIWFWYNFLVASDF
jgi:hypothetical protein